MEDEKMWERWHKDRVFVRGIVGKYADLLKNLLDQPRVYKTRSVPWKGGPVLFVKPMIDPDGMGITQAIETEMNVLTPGGWGPRHGHMNGAVFYILEGKGYDVHDGERYDWEAGDACIVRNGCVHQHFNESEDITRMVVFKSKPLFLFFNLVFQKNATYPKASAKPGWEDYSPKD